MISDGRCPTIDICFAGVRRDSEKNRVSKAYPNLVRGLFRKATQLGKRLKEANLGKDTVKEDIPRGDTMTENIIKEEVSGSNCCCCGKKTKERSPEEYQKLIHRLNRIEGQIRGLKGMIERDAYCTDILIQSSAVAAALNAFNKELLANHIRTCVADDIREGNDEVIDELVDTLQKLMK